MHVSSQDPLTVGLRQRLLVLRACRVGSDKALMGRLDLPASPQVKFFFRAQEIVPIVFCGGSASLRLRINRVWIRGAFSKRRTLANLGAADGNGLRAGRFLKVT
ncbi:hypothetical protein CP49_38005 [Bradyrhizobium valentinum]|uniref:Uncharacterized protein n=1 Tax=Bradyrhizobium valentinum TaxID=1518501 RepID=A0A0R3KRJ2_9BRAD|nr:hypothetical protein CP49_38005 [Bradyrhizobium valentinum]